jgi:hypothetical protein
LNITGIITYSENFESILGLGVLPLIFIFSAFFILILFTLFKKKKSIPKKEYEELSSDIDKSPTEPISAGKIKCPKCHKQIDEGLTFCPECGERIPEFLRYNPISGI